MIIPIVAASSHQYNRFLEESGFPKFKARYITRMEQLRGMAGPNDNLTLFLLEGYQQNHMYTGSFFDELNHHVRAERFSISFIPEKLFLTKSLY